MSQFDSKIWTQPSKIVIGLDIGTTQSAVAFSYLHEGTSQSLQRVSSWPGQEAHRGDSKIPSVVWYDSDEQARYFGAEAYGFDALEEAEDYHWHLAKHFKLHLHPDTMKAKYQLRTDPLPPGVDVAIVYGDFMRYLLQHTQNYFQGHILDGEDVWETYSPTMDIVITHPNGWGLVEQAVLRKAAVSTGYVGATDAMDRIKFVSEAEASVHFCMFHANLDSSLQIGTNFIVCDAGGSTVDTTVYGVTRASPRLQLEEKKPSACVQAGGIFVDGAFDLYLRTVFKRADLDATSVAEFTKRGVRDFELNAKKTFSKDSKSSVVVVGSEANTNIDLNIRRGRMTLQGSEVNRVFKPFVDQITTSVEDQASGLDIKHILLVGGFGESPFVREALLDN